VEEIAYTQGFITREQVVARGQLFAKTNYGQSLLRLASRSRCHREAL
jgi:glucose-1-phosphate thymidylyltransferase